MTLLKRTLFCVFGVMQCLRGLRLKKHISFHKALPFWNKNKAHHSEKRGVLWLASYPVRCDWPNTSSTWQMLRPLPYLETHSFSTTWRRGNNTTARIKVTPSFFAYTFGQCYANLPTQWRRFWGGVWRRDFRKAWMSLNFRKIISFALRL